MYTEHWTKCWCGRRLLLSALIIFSFWIFFIVKTGWIFGWHTPLEFDRFGSHWLEIYSGSWPCGIHMPGWWSARSGHVHNSRVAFGKYLRIWHAAIAYSYACALGKYIGIIDGDVIFVRNLDSATVGNWKTEFDIVQVPNERTERPDYADNGHQTGKSNYPLIHTINKSFKNEKIVLIRFLLYLCQCKNSVGFVCCGTIEWPYLHSCWPWIRCVQSTCLSTPCGWWHLAWFDIASPGERM